MYNGALLYEDVYLVPRRDLPHPGVWTIETAMWVPYPSSLVCAHPQDSLIHRHHKGPSAHGSSH